MEKYLFLLGGKDLEMVEIAKLLDECDQKFLDKNLSWGAKLSDYREELISLRGNQIVVGIELLNDIDVCQNYISIDHHNDNVHKPSSIEQVADLLDYKLCRYQQLVAKNDVGYIPAMLEFGATQEEVRQIRRADRKCQGVTEEDERLAVESIKSIEEQDGVAIVKSLVDKFSPICDRLYPIDKLIVYTDDEINYYGKLAQELGRRYQKRYGEDIVYYGGGADGYFGFSKGSVNSVEIQEIVEEVVDYVRRKETT